MRVAYYALLSSAINLDGFLQRQKSQAVQFREEFTNDQRETNEPKLGASSSTVAWEEGWLKPKHNHAKNTKRSNRQNKTDHRHHRPHPIPGHYSKTKGNQLDWALPIP